MTTEEAALTVAARISDDARAALLLMLARIDNDERSDDE